jgi:Coenzyme PQQ synthesis protein D (PqqD)
MTNQLRTRESDLVVQDLKSEILIYDLRIDKAFCLNFTAAIVWRLCDGKRSAAEMSQLISEKLESPVSEDFIWLALDQLKRENLLATPEVIKNKFAGLSRRELAKKIGLGSMIALPLITSVVAPTAINAQSGNACTRDGQRFCISPQPDDNSCFNNIDVAAVTRCCARTAFGLVFGSAQDPNACCGTCGRGE